MKGAYAFDTRGTIHEWRATAVSTYLERKCNSRQVYFSDVQLSESDIKGLPLCKRCFPVGKAAGK